MAQLFGKNYQEAGSSSSPLLLRSNGEIKLQWGNKFIDNLSMDLKMEFPEVKGFSIRNLKYMRKFAEEYPDFKFGDLPNNQKKAVKHVTSEEAEVTYEMNGLNLKRGTTYYIRVGVTHIANGGDYNHSKIISIIFE